MRVSAKSANLHVYGLVRTTTVPIAAIRDASMEEVLTPGAGLMYLPVVGYRDVEGVRRRTRLWILAHKSRPAAEAALSWVESIR